MDYGHYHRSVCVIFVLVDSLFDFLYYFLLLDDSTSLRMLFATAALCKMGTPVCGSVWFMV